MSDDVIDAAVKVIRRHVGRWLPSDGLRTDTAPTIARALADAGLLRDPHTDARAKVTEDSDIVFRLRAVVSYYGCDPGVPMSVVDDCAEAANVIERLRDPHTDAIVDTEGDACDHCSCWEIDLGVCCHCGLVAT